MLLAASMHEDCFQTKEADMNMIKGLALGTVALAATVMTGCLFSSKSDSNSQPASIVISMGVKDINNLGKSGLGKTATAPGIVLHKLIVTLTSSVGGDAVIRDTILADTGVFVSNSASSQSILRNYPVKALRNWTIQVKTLDVNDSVIHIASSTQNNLLIGENRLVTLNLSSKYVVYAAKFALPDSLGSLTSTQKQKLFVNRFVMIVDGDTVRDTSATPGFFTAKPDTHTVAWNYVKADTAHDLELYVFADSIRMDSISGGNWKWPKNLPLYGDVIHITSTDTTYTPELPWTGPGSPSDPNYNPSNPGGARAGLTINIGAVGSVVIVPGLPGTPLPKRK
jgi:hypothetical protein